MPKIVTSWLTEIRRHPIIYALTYTGSATASTAILVTGYGYPLFTAMSAATIGVVIGSLTLVVGEACWRRIRSGRR